MNPFFTSFEFLISLNTAINKETKHSAGWRDSYMIKRRSHRDKKVILLVTKSNIIYNKLKVMKEI
jgi:hypothetical protein